MSGSLDQSEGKPNLTPILDMVFQLITFFMLVINFKAAAIDTSLKLPVVGDARRIKSEGPGSLLTLNINKEGSLKVYGEEKKDIQNYIASEAHAEWLNAKRKKPDLEFGQDLPTLVVVRADRNTPYHMVHRVIEACQKNGFREFALKGLSKGEE